MTSKYDLICCDVSGVSKNIAEVTGWFPTEVPKADDTGSNLIVRVVEGSPEHLKEGGCLNICTTSFSNIEEIENTMQKSFPDKWEKILEKEEKLGAHLKFEDIIKEVSGVYPKVMLEGDMDAGAWSCGMVAGLIHDIPTVKELVDRIMEEAEDLIKTYMRENNVILFLKKNFESSDVQGCEGKVIGTNVAQGATMSTGDTLIFIVENSGDNS